MKRHLQLELAAPECVAEDFEDEIVILNTATGLYFSVRDSGLAIWRALAEGCAVETIVEAGERDPQFERCVRAFVEDVLAKGLMRPVKEPRRSASTPPLDIETIRLSGIPALESYDDMQSLLLLCPVHDDGSNRSWLQRIGATVRRVISRE